MKIKYQMEKWQLLLVFLKISIKKFINYSSKTRNTKRKFTHISDTIDLCIKAWKKNKCKHYSISGRENLTILQVAKMFKNDIKIFTSQDWVRDIPLNL